MRIPIEIHILFRKERAYLSRAESNALFNIQAELLESPTVVNFYLLSNGVSKNLFIIVMRYKANKVKPPKI